MNGTPPWVRDRHPEYWVLAAVAARFYFRKSLTTVKRMIKDGTLEDAGILSYWDGTRWHLRLPEMITPQRTNRSA